MIGTCHKDLRRFLQTQYLVTDYQNKGHQAVAVRGQPSRAWKPPLLSSMDRQTNVALPALDKLKVVGGEFAIYE